MRKWLPVAWMLGLGLLRQRPDDDGIFWDSGLHAQSGNGRVARALASLIFIRKRWFPLVIDRDTVGEYIEALESGDKGDLQAF